MRYIYLTLLFIISLQQCHASDKIKVIGAKIGYADFYETYRGVGKTELIKSQDFFAGRDGRVEFITTKDSQKICKNEVILTIDGTAAMEKKKAKELALEVAENEYKRNLSLYKRKVIPIEILHNSKLSVNQALTELEIFKNEYEHVILSAPFDGYTGAINVKHGGYITKGKYLFTLTTNLPHYVIYSSLPEKYASQITKLDMAFIIDSFGNEELCKINSVSKYLSNNGTSNIKLSFFSDNKAKFMHGGYYDILIRYNAHRSLAVPQSAILRDNQGSFVFKITNNAVIDKIYLDLGIQTNNMTELKSNNLKENDTIVLEGLTKVKQGSLIEITN